MGYNNEFGTAVVLDLEAVGIDEVEKFLDPVSAPANYKDPEKIEAAKKEKRQTQIERAALDIDLCRIVALGYDCHEIAVTQYIPDEKAEIEALTFFWELTVNAGGGVRPLITFNGLRYDLPVLMRRSWALGVKFPLLNLDKYRTHHLDLYNELTFKGAVDGHSLDFYLKRYAIDIGPDSVEGLENITGADIARLHQEGQRDLILAHCDRDVRGTKAMARRLRLIPESYQ